MRMLDEQQNVSRRLKLLARDELLWSDQMSRIHGLEPGAARPSVRTILEVVHPDDRQFVAERLLSVFDTDGTAIIIHGNEDQGITGAPKSGVSGGPRVACGVLTKK